jgi:hypothetical protein
MRSLSLLVILCCVPVVVQTQSAAKCPWDFPEILRRWRQSPLCYNYILYSYESISETSGRRLALACLHFADGKGERACRRLEKASEIWCSRPSSFGVCASK